VVVEEEGKVEEVVGREVGAQMLRPKKSRGVSIESGPRTEMSAVRRTWETRSRHASLRKGSRIRWRRDTLYK
jgi:hypothetical protein